MEEETSVEVPMEEPLEDQMEDEPIDEETEEGPMYEEPIEIEESKEGPMEGEEQGGQDGAGDPDDGDDSDNSDSDDGGNDGGDGDGGDGGDDSGDDGGDGDRDGGDGGGDGDDYHAALLAKGWTAEIHYDLQGDAYYHPKLFSLVRRYHTRCTVQYRIEHWTHLEYTNFEEMEVYIHKGSRVRYIHRAITALLTRVAAIWDAAR